MNKQTNIEEQKKENISGKDARQVINLERKKTKKKNDIITKNETTKTFSGNRDDSNMKSKKVEDSDKKKHETNIKELTEKKMAAKNAPPKQYANEKFLSVKIPTKSKHKRKKTTHTQKKLLKIETAYAEPNKTKIEENDMKPNSVRSIIEIKILKEDECSYDTPNNINSASKISNLGNIDNVGNVDNVEDISTVDKKKNEKMEAETNEAEKLKTQKTFELRFTSSTDKEKLKDCDRREKTKEINEIDGSKKENESKKTKETKKNTDRNESKETKETKEKKKNTDRNETKDTKEQKDAKSSVEKKQSRINFQVFKKDTPKTNEHSNKNMDTFNQRDLERGSSRERKQNINTTGNIASNFNFKKASNSNDSYNTFVDTSILLCEQDTELINNNYMDRYRHDIEHSGKRSVNETGEIHKSFSKYATKSISINSKDVGQKKRHKSENVKDTFIKVRHSFKKYFAEIWRRNITIKKNTFISNKYFPHDFGINELNINHSNANDLMTQIPLRFKDDAIEELYVLNLNGWISSRMIIIGVIMICLCAFIWPLCVWSFKHSKTWHRDNYVATLFHCCMSINICLLVFFIIIGFTRLRNYAETLAYTSFSIMLGVWGIWNIISCTTLKADFKYKLIPGLSSAVETIYALTYIYGVLPLVITDVFFPSRTKYNWILHVIFIVLNSASIMTVGIMNPEYIPAAYVVFRIVANMTVCIFLYIGCYTCELQTRYVFYNLLITGYKLDKVECDLSKFKKEHKFSTAIEELLMMIKECNKLSLEVKNDLDTNLSIHNKMSYCHSLLEDCLSLLTKNENLYNVDYEMFDKLESKKFIEAYVSKKNTGFFDDDEDTEFHKLHMSYSNTDCVCARKVALDRKEIKAFLKTLDASRVKAQIKKIGPTELNNWDFNCLEYFSKSKSAFYDITISLFYTIPVTLFSELTVNFLAFVENQYNNVPYHNVIHATMVAQKFFCLSNKLGISGFMDTKIKLVMFIASICHDVGHPGFNNLFFVNSFHPLSILYNDISVLENYHASITFKILKLKQCNILKSFTDKDFRVMRSYIIELILCTDMQFHFEKISKFRVRRTNEDFDFVKNSDDLLLVLKMLIKSADVSHGTVQWEEHYKWCQRVLGEFYAQGDEEIKNKLPLSPLCDRSKHSEVSKSQLTFLKYVVMPLYVELSYIDANNFIQSFCVKRLNDNCDEWEKLSRMEQLVDVFNVDYDEIQKKKKKYQDRKKKSYVDLGLLFVRNISE